MEALLLMSWVTGRPGTLAPHPPATQTWLLPRPLLALRGDVEVLWGPRGGQPAPEAQLPILGSPCSQSAPPPRPPTRPCPVPSSLGTWGDPASAHEGGVGAVCRRRAGFLSY